MARTVYRVLPHEGSWQLRRDDAVVSDYERKQDAVDRGRKTARGDQPSQLVVHDRDGRIEHESTYQDDPFPPQG
jgi:hypothetical protein